MKKIILSVALVSTALAFAQKKEINAAYKAADAGDIATATAQVTAAEAALAGKPAEPALMEKLYYAKGVALIKSGKVAEGAAVLAKINELKSDKFSPSLTEKIGPIVNPLLQNANKAAMDAYNAKNYSAAAPKFKEVYSILKATGQDNKTYLYYSALTYALANDKANAIAGYGDLIKSGYTGVETTYSAKNKKTGAVENLDKNTFDLYKKMGASSDYSDFKTETSKSIEQELYDTQAGLLMEAERYDEALAVIDAGIKKFPADAKLAELQGTAYYKTGKTDQFIQNLKNLVSKNPQDKASWYNLGVLASKDPAKAAEAEGYFKKALEADPNYIPALQAIFYNVYLGDDKAVTDSAEAARKAGKIEVFNKILDDRRARFVKGLPYLEKWYSLEPKNLELVSLLKGVYQTTRNDAKFKEFKAKEAALQK